MTLATPRIISCLTSLRCSLMHKPMNFTPCSAAYPFSSNRYAGSVKSVRNAVSARRASTPLSSFLLPPVSAPVVVVVVNVVLVAVVGSLWSSVAL
ncbi:MAG: hypothetical protein SFY68_00370 [Candidatus Sumerlaeia bacterium]|nr:hypothetical protein [Candidatus Sumerlaeia bacterium]